MYLNRCKFEFSKDPRQFYNFVNAKRKSSALPSSVRLNSIEAFTDPEIAGLFAEFFQYSSVSWSNSSYPNHLNRASSIFSPVITESSLLSYLETITPKKFVGLALKERYERPCRVYLEYRTCYFGENQARLKVV